jgi:hypothetical protein
MEPIQREGTIEYLEEGFLLKWDARELCIMVTDYHAGSLRLSWKDLLALARVAGKLEAAVPHDGTAFPDLPGPRTHPT